MQYGYHNWKTYISAPVQLISSDLSLGNQSLSQIFSFLSFQMEMIITLLHAYWDVNVILWKAILQAENVILILPLLLSYRSKEVSELLDCTIPGKCWYQMPVYFWRFKSFHKYVSQLKLHYKAQKWTPYEQHWGTRKDMFRYLE